MKKIRIDARRRAVLVALAHRYATEGGGATTAEVVEGVSRNVRGATTNTSHCYAALGMLMRVGLAQRKAGRNASWRPTPRGLLFAATWCMGDEVNVREDVRDAVAQAAATADKLTEAAGEAAQMSKTHRVFKG